MAKRGKLSKVEKLYIEDNRTKTVQEIALSLDRTESAVQKHLDTLPEEVQEEKPAPETTTPVFDNGNPLRPTIGRKTVGGRDGVSIWNETASQIADETRDSRVGKINRFTKDAIHKPFGD